MKKRIRAKAQKRKRRNKQKYNYRQGILHYTGGSPDEKSREKIIEASKTLSARSIARASGIKRRIVKRILRKEQEK